MAGKEFTDQEKLQNQVRWLEEQLIGHEKNFDIQFDKIEKLKTLLSNTKAQLKENIRQLDSSDAKIKTLTMCLDRIQNSNLPLFNRNSRLQNLKEEAAVIAYEAAAYKHLVETLVTLSKEGKLKSRDLLNQLVLSHDKIVEERLTITDKV